MATTKAVLIIGGSGFIGTHLALKLRESHKVFATYLTKPMRIPGVTFIPLDVGNRNWVKRIVYSSRPDVVIYAAGSSNLDWAEAHARDAERVHTGGPATVSNVADILQPRFIYLSNCYVFDGNKGNYHEGDIVLPSYSLGKVKVGGENFIRGKAMNHIIIRSSPLLGCGNGRNISFLDHLRMKLIRNERIELPVSEFHSFAFITSFIDFVAKMVDSGPKNKTLHYGGLTKLTHYELARKFAKRFSYNEDLIFQSQHTKRGSIEAEIADYSLNSSWVAENLKIKPLLLEECFDLLEKELVSSF